MSLGVKIRAHCWHGAPVRDYQASGTPIYRILQAFCQALNYHSPARHASEAIHRLPLPLDQPHPGWL